MVLSVCNQTLRLILSSSPLIAMVVVVDAVLLFAYIVSKHMKIKVSPSLHSVCMGISMFYVFLRILTKSEQNTSDLKMAVFLIVSRPHFSRVKGVVILHEIIDVLQQIQN